jgi:hypothetical protein
MNDKGINVIEIEGTEITPELIRRYMDLLSDMKCNSFIVLPKHVEMDWKGLCVDCNIRNWLRQMRWYFGWRKE